MSVHKFPVKATTDVWLMAFLQINFNQFPCNYRVIGKGRIECEYDVDEETWTAYKLAFNASIASNYKQVISQLKDLGF